MTTKDREGKLDRAKEALKKIGEGIADDFGRIEWQSMKVANNALKEIGG